MEQSALKPRLLDPAGVQHAKQLDLPPQVKVDGHNAKASPGFRSKPLLLLPKNDMAAH